MDSNMCQSPTNNHGFWVDIGVQGSYLKDMAGSYWHQHPCPAFQSSVAISWWKRAPWLFWVATVYGKRGTQTAWDGANVAESHNLKPDLSEWIWSGSQGTLPEACPEICVWQTIRLKWPPHRSWVFGLNSTYVHLHPHQSSLLDHQSPEFQWSSDGSNHATRHGAVVGPGAILVAAHNPLPGAEKKARDPGMAIPLWLATIPTKNGMYSYGKLWL